MDKRQATHDLLKELNELGSPDQIARWLMSEGAYGKPQDAHRCPLARYLHRELGGQWCVGAYTVKQRWNPFHRLFGGGVRVPRRVRRFIADFDEGCFFGLSEIGHEIEMRLPRPPVRPQSTTTPPARSTLTLVDR